jgi:hypothetical protein
MVRWRATTGFCLAIVAALLCATPLSATAQEATPVPAADASCEAEARSLDEISALVSTPIADWGFDPADPPVFPSLPSEPADAETIAGITELLQIWVACINTGDPLQVAALQTDDFLARSTDLESLTEPTGEVSPDQYYVLIDVVYVRVYEGGRVGAVAIFGQPSSPGALSPDFFFFAKSGDRWLVDGDPLYFPEGPGLPDDATPTAPVAAGEVIPPEACTIPPRSAESLATLTGTPAPPPKPGEDEPSLAPVVGPPDDATLAGVEETARMWIACINAGDPERLSAIFSEAFFQQPYITIDWASMQGELPPAEWSGFLGLYHPLLYADGRVGVVVASATGSWSPVDAFFVVFSPAGDRWQIDIFGVSLYQDVEFITEEEVILE